jgi:hypothetical protein
MLLALAAIPATKWPTSLVIVTRNTFWRSRLALARLPRRERPCRWRFAELNQPCPDPALRILHDAKAGCSRRITPPVCVTVSS